MYSRIHSFIRERFQNKDKLYSIGDSAIVSLGRFFAGIALAKLAGAEAFAQYLLLLTAGFFILSIPSTRCIIPMINLSSGLEAQKRFGIFKWTHRNIYAFMAGGIGLFSVAYPLVNYYNIPLFLYLGFSLTLVAWLELMYQRACLQILFKMRGAALADLFALIILISVVAISFFKFNNPVAGFWWGSAISSFIAAKCMAYWVKQESRGHKGTEIPNKDIQKQANSSGNAMLIGSIANSLCARLAPFVLGSIGGLITVASFGASWTLVGPLRMLSGAISGLLRPRLAMFQNLGKSDNFQRSLNQAYLLVGVVGAIGILVSAIFGPYIITFLFDASLRSAGFLLPLAMFYATVEVVTSIQVIALHTKYTSGAVIATKLRILAAAISLTFIYPLSVWLGAWGAYLTILLAELLYFFCALLILKSKSPLPFLAFQRPGKHLDSPIS